jgi:hypothetical protein
MRVAIREMSSWVSSSVRGKFVQVGRNVALVYALIVGLMSMDELVEMLSMDELHHVRDAPPEKINEQKQKSITRALARMHVLKRAIRPQRERRTHITHAHRHRHARTHAHTTSHTRTHAHGRHLSTQKDSKNNACIKTKDRVPQQKTRPHEQWATLLSRRSFLLRVLCSL